MLLGQIRDDAFALRELAFILGQLRFQGFELLLFGFNDLRLCLDLLTQAFRSLLASAMFRFRSETSMRNFDVTFSLIASPPIIVLCRHIQRIADHEAAIRWTFSSVSFPEPSCCIRFIVPPQIAAEQHHIMEPLLLQSERIQRRKSGA